MNSKYPTRYSSTLELATLPWFERRGEQLTLDPAVGPVIDVHTHIALTYGRRSSVDLDAAPRATEHYLPLDHELDLDPYCNRNFTDDDLFTLKVDLSVKSLTRTGMRETHTAPNLLAEMKALNITHSVMLPIDFPMFSWNSETYLEVAQRYDGLLSTSGVHPHKKDALRVLEHHAAAGACGLKMHPAVQMLPPDHPKAMALYGACGELGIPIMWHGGPVGIESSRARQRCQLKNYWKAVHDFPGTTFIFGHAGALQYDMAIKLAKVYPNVYLELASQGLAGTRRIIAEAPIDRVMQGSDWPFYPLAISIAKALIATEGMPTERRLVLYENAARLYGLASASSSAERSDRELEKVVPPSSRRPAAA